MQGASLAPRIGPFEDGVIADEGVAQHMREERTAVTNSLDDRIDQLHTQLDRS